MAVREFDGVTGTGATMTFGPGNVGAINNGVLGVTMLMVVKPLSLAGIDPYISIGELADVTSIAALYYTATGTELSWGSSDPDADCLATSNLTANAWQVIAITKTPGTSIPRIHRKVLGSGSWTHVNTNASCGSSTGGAAVNIQLSRFTGDAGGERVQMRCAVAAVWNMGLADLTIEGIEADATTAGVLAQSPAWCVDLNQASTSTTARDLVGTGHETAKVGTTVVTNDDPPWQFAPLGGSWKVRSGGQAERARA